MTFLKGLYILDILQHNIEKFNGRFQRDCQEHSTLPSLKSFIGTVMHAAGSSDCEYYNQTLFSVSQLSEFNTIICSSKNLSSTYHSVN